MATGNHISAHLRTAQVTSLLRGTTSVLLLFGFWQLLSLHTPANIIGCYNHCTKTLQGLTDALPEFTNHRFGRDPPVAVKRTNAPLKWQHHGSSSTSLWLQVPLGPESILFGDCWHHVQIRSSGLPLKSNQPCRIRTAPEIKLAHIHVHDFPAMGDQSPDRTLAQQQSLRLAQSLRSAWSSESVEDVKNS